MEHTRGQEREWGGLCESVHSELGNDYAVDRSIPHVVKVSRRLQPIREAILNFAGEDLHIHYEEGGPQSLPRSVRVQEDGTLLELRTNSPISKDEVVSGIRNYLAA